MIYNRRLDRDFNASGTSMKLNTVYARFYKSFNFDHLRKAHPSAQKRPWEDFRGSWYPYVEVPLDREITTVVGANESGKSHLLSAIEKAITGVDFNQRDLCRYSPFFSVERGSECWPHLGVSWSDVAEAEAKQLREELSSGPSTFDSFLMFREGPELLTVYLPNPDGSFASQVIEGDKATNFGEGVLPKPFRIRPDIALPNSVPLKWLVDGSAVNGALGSRAFRSATLDAVGTVLTQWIPDAQQFAQRAAHLHSSLAPIFGPKGKLHVPQPAESQAALQLARDLLIRLGNVEPDRLEDLSDAIADGADGHANALVKRINEQVGKQLNLSKWWVQDRDFSLRITPREMDLVFTIQDRTGTEYAFSERSSGLKYFLSYLIQSQSRERSKDRPEILLMDEPDTYLSAEAQQDLLKIFHDFAKPESDAAPVQVVFVTHSPFLIDKNHAERIRVLEKGKGLDGTRVIKNASQNHYEPLRSAFGAFVGETAFIGACNLLVEGVADQVLLSGAARLIRSSSTDAASETLDLNRLVLVPCGSAGQIPYMLYLIRGRDADKPPVIALLDSDKAGNDAADLMRKDDKKMRRLIKRDYVLQLGQLDLIDGAPQPTELEDLVPGPLAVAAANAFLAEVAQFRDLQVPPLTVDDFEKNRASGTGVFDALNAAAAGHGQHIEKIGFARAVYECCRTVHQNPALAEEVDRFLARMRRLFRIINGQRRRAEKDALMERVGSRVDRQQTIFLQDHPHQASKDQALFCLENIEDVLDESIESDAVRAQLNKLKRTYDLDGNPAEKIGAYPEFAAALRALKDEFELRRLNPGDS